MPIATFPHNWDIEFKAVLQKRIGEAVRNKVAKVAAPVDKVRILAIAEKFLRLYRENLQQSTLYTNLNIPSIFYPGPLGGYPNVTEATSKPLLGAIGLPPSLRGAQYALTEKIKLGIYAQLNIRTRQDGSQLGVLNFDFRAFSNDQLAKYNDGSKNISWVNLIEYGFDTSGYVYVPKVGVGRSGYGVMQKSKRFDFQFAATHLFEDTFRLTKRMLSPEEQLTLLAIFLE
jgi:hypothetical protein